MAGGVLDFLQTVGQLKRVPRAGWVVHGVSNPECVAGHMHRMAVMSLLALDAVTPPGEALDVARATRITLVHDLAEAIVGDITPHDGIDEDEKHAREAAAIDAMCAQLASWPKACAAVREAYAEYEEGRTPEARWIKDCDKLDMLLQALEYERLEPRLHLVDFFKSTEGRFKTPLGQSLAEEVRVRRAESSGAKRTAIERALRQSAHWATQAAPYLVAFAAGATAVLLSSSLRGRRLYR
jgi:putative hydrolases of HD superfamily